MTNAVVYCRISRDTEGQALGVERQRQDCVEMCNRREWNVAGVLIDNDVSAYSGKRRPGYEAALGALKDGTADVLVAWHPDRLHRNPRELENFIDLIEATGTTVATVTAGEVDLATPEGRLHARIVGAVARKESEDKSRRLRRKHQELAEHGRTNGGRRPFGYKADQIHHDPKEAKLVREAASRVLAGESLYAIEKDWTSRGVPTVTGAAWSTTALRTMLTAPRMAGLRSHHGDIVGEAEWDGILDRDTWEAVRATLATRSRSRTRAPRAYLLTGGLARCSECGGKLVAAPRPYGRAYACLATSGGCNKVSIKAEPVEELVTEALFQVVDGADLGKVLAPPSSSTPVADTLADIDQRLADVADLFAAGDITRAEWMRARAGLDERRRDAQAAVDEVSAPSPAVPYLGKVDALRSAWPSLSLDQRRAIVAAVVDAVVIVPGRRGGGKVDLSRVDVRWRV